MTSDGVRLAADLVVPAGARGAAVLLHPHPRFGGNRLNAVVAALFRALPEADIAALRFDFRAGAGGEVAAVGLGVDHAAVTARVAIAPPLAVMAVAPASPRPTLVLVPAFDQFSPPPAIQPIVAGWPDATVEVIDGADHFLVGRAAAAADRATAWLVQQLG